MSPLKTRLEFPSQGLSTSVWGHRIATSLTGSDRDIYALKQLITNIEVTGQNHKETGKRSRGGGADNGLFLRESNVALVSERRRTRSRHIIPFFSFPLSGVLQALETNDESSLFSLGSYLGGSFMKNLDFRVCLLSWNLVNTPTYPSGIQKRRILGPCGL